MEALKSKIETLLTEISNTHPKDASELEIFRIKFLGSKGIVKDTFAEMKTVPKEFKRDAGLLLNSLKQAAENQYKQFEHLNKRKSDFANKLDLSLPGNPLPLGSRHP